MRLLKLLLPAIALFSLHEKILAPAPTPVVPAPAALMNQLENESRTTQTMYAAGTFKYTRVVNGQSVENLPTNVLDFRISHRFGPLNQGLYNFFGLDYAAFNVRIGFDYGITNSLMIGVGHNAYLKTYDAFFKLKILKQSKGAVNMPFTVSFVPTISINTVKSSDFGYDFSDSTETKKAEPLIHSSYLLEENFRKDFHCS